MKSILPESYLIENEVQSQADLFLKKYRISTLLKQSNFRKDKGFSCFLIFRFVFLLVFTGKNLYRLILTQNCNEQLPAKDSIYRFLNSAKYNWRKFLLALSSAIVRDISSLTSEDRVNVLILDDSLYSRNRSKTVELLSRVKDHIRNKYVCGFRMLTLGWSDGNTFLPLAFTLLGSENEKKWIKGINPNIDKRTNGYKLRKEGTKKSTQALLDLLDQVSRYNVPAQYLLFDSWFAYPKVILDVLERNLNVICMLKTLPFVHYRYMDKQFNLKSLYNYIYKKPGKAKILASVLVELGKNKAGEPVKVKIVFVRDRNRSRKWLALLSTDTELSNEEIIRIYGKRWNIEVFFKTTKTCLKLAKEFQGRSYDSMVAHTTIVFCRYIMLAMESRNNDDVRTVGELFYLCCDELRDITFSRSISLLMEILKDTLLKNLLLPEKIVMSLLDQFISSLPSHFKARLQIPMCES